MLKNLFWGRRPEPAIYPNPFFAIEMDAKTGDVKGYCHFPQPATEQEARSLAAKFGKLLFLLNDGSFLPIIQNWVVLGGVDSNAEVVAHMTLNTLNQLLAQKAQHQGHADGPLVRPTAAFAPNRSQGAMPND